MTKHKKTDKELQPSLGQEVKTWLQNHPGQSIGPSELAKEIGAKLAGKDATRSPPSRQIIGVHLQKMVDDGFAVRSDRGTYELKAPKEDYAELLTKIKERGRVSRKEFDQIVSSIYAGSKDAGQILGYLSTNGYVQTKIIDGVVDSIENLLAKYYIFKQCPLCGEELNHGDVVCVDSVVMVRTSEEDYEEVSPTVCFHKNCFIAGILGENPPHCCVRCRLPLDPEDIIEIVGIRKSSWEVMIKQYLYGNETYYLDINGKQLAEAGLSVQELVLGIPNEEYCFLRHFENFLEQLEVKAQCYNARKMLEHTTDRQIFASPALYATRDSLRYRAKELFKECSEEMRRLNTEYGLKAQEVLKEFFPSVDITTSIDLIERATPELNFAEPQYTAGVLKQRTFEIVMIDGREYHPGCALKVKKAEGKENYA